MGKIVLLILGPNGVGKSTTARTILEKLPHSALVDSDWCRAMNPYDMEVATNNMYALLRNYLSSPNIKTLIVPYGFHGDRQQRYDMVKEKLTSERIVYEEFPVVLKCSYDELILRLYNDLRNDERIKRGIRNTFDFYDNYDFPVIETTGLSADEASDMIIALLAGRK